MSSSPRALTVSTSKGKPIDVRVYTPPNDVDGGGERPVVLVAPDILLDPDGGPLPQVARALGDAGFVVATYSGSTAPASGRYRETTFAQALEDLGAVLNAFFERTFDGPEAGLAARIDNHRIGALGHGFGGAVAVAAARRDTRLRAVLAAGAPGSPNSLFSPSELEEFAARGSAEIRAGERSHRLDGRFITEWHARGDQYDLAPSAEELEVPVLFIHGTRDERAPIDDARAAYYRQSRHGRLVEVEGADHAFAGAAQRRLAEEAVAFFRETLGALAVSARA